MSRLIALLTAGVLVLAACGGASQVAATVNGTEITAGELDALRPGGTATAEEAANDLNLLVSTEIVLDGLADLGLEITDEERQEAEDEIVAGIEAQGTSFEDFKAENEITDELVEIAITQQVAQEKALEHFSDDIEVTDEEIQEQYDVELQSRSTVCASHILIGMPQEEDEEAQAEAEAEAEALADEVFDLASEEGADFSALAQEYSTGPSGPEGGDLGCSSPAQYVPTFGQATLDAELDVPYGPVQTQFGWHVILVTDRDVPGIDDTVVNAAGEEVLLRDDLAATIEQTKGFEASNEWFAELLANADVTVDPDFGTWGPDANGNNRVLPPTASG